MLNRRDEFRTIIDFSLFLFSFFLFFWSLSLFPLFYGSLLQSSIGTNSPPFHSAAQSWISCNYITVKAHVCPSSPEVRGLFCFSNHVGSLLVSTKRQPSCKDPFQWSPSCVANIRRKTAEGKINPFFLYIRSINIFSPEIEKQFAAG